jgi:hypothetical protein
VNRQYGIVDFDSQGHPRSAALTGSGCLNWKGHRLGTNYAIQGNILSGPEILDSMEARFLAATGSLSDRLMACLQGANVPGADSRCLQNGTSSLSAFVRVAKPGDADDNFWLDLNVPSLPAGMEPIDSLQRLYDQWKTTINIIDPTEMSVIPVISPNPASGWFNVSLPFNSAQLALFDLAGRNVFRQTIQKGDNRLTPKIQPGVYFVRIQAENQPVHTLRLVWAG